MSLVSGDAPRRAPLPVSPGALVGRDRELATLVGLLTDPDVRLVTLTGPPGVGKTRLAVAAAAGTAQQFADGVAFVDLTSVQDPGLVAAEVTAAVGAGDADPARLPADRELLLVVDNFEHVLPAGAALTALVAARPRLTVLVTSRERLHLRAERELPVMPLALPLAGDIGDPERLAATPSIALLLHQVRGHQPDFTVTTANGPALAEICVRLDGLPLALELAASRLRLFTPGELTFRLRHRVGALTGDAWDAPERHRTLQSALAWSHDLLGPEERVLFRRLSVFTGGWTRASAQEVGGVTDVDATLASLVDKSLVRRLGGPGGSPRDSPGDSPEDVARFGMLESLREFATELLEQAGEADATRERHAEYFTALAEGIEARVATPDERAAIDEVGAEAGNLRAALTDALAGSRTGSALIIASALGWYHYTRGQLGTGQTTMETTIQAANASADAPPDDALAGVLFMSGAVALVRGDLDLADRRLHQSLTLNERVGSRRRTAVATAFLGHLARARGRTEEAVAHHEQAGRLHQELGNVHGVAWSRYDLGLLARRRRDTERAADLLRESLVTFRDLHYVWAIGCSAWALATVDLRRKRPDEAAELLTEALVSFEGADDLRGVAQCLEATAALACDRNAERSAARLLGAAATLRDRLAAPLPEEDREALEVAARHVQQTVGSEAADAAERAGRAMPTRDALALARAVLTGDAAEDAIPAPRTGGLTRRESQVATLVRHGRTNRQIGRQLGITEKTTEVHVHNIIRKLGASSRAEIAAWVAARNGGSGA